MKNYCKILSIVLATVALAGCEEEDADLLFTVEHITNENNVSFEYYSPDPSCVPKMYWIKTDRQSSALTIQCTNADNIYFDNRTDPSPDKYTSPDATWTAELVGTNTVTFTFNEISAVTDTSAPSFLSDGLNIAANTKKGQRTTYISVTRYTPPTL